MEQPALAARYLSKTFDGVRALDGVGISIWPGEVHGLLGENGSGKSTLIHILAGYHAPDSGGELDVHGKNARLPLRPDRSLQLGMRFVHQDLGLFPSLSVTENLLIGDLGAGRRERIVGRSARARADRVLRRVGLDVDGATRVGELRASERAWLAIGRAMEGLRTSPADEQDCGLLVLDEPTAYLPAIERHRLFSMLQAIATTGTSVLLVSHDLGEALRVTARITVLRDGRSVATVPTAGLRPDDLVVMLTGRHPPAALARRASPRRARVTASINELSGEIVSDVSIDLHEGEIVGLTGPGGSGYEEVASLLVGVRPARSGRVTLDRGYDLSAMTPAKARRARLALVPGDRQHDGGVPGLSVADNLSLPVLDHHGSGLRFSRRTMREAAALLAAYSVQPNRPAMAYGALSGGNQQKALLAKWLHTEPVVLLLDEPTRSIDVGARQQLWTTIRAVADRGVSVICATSNYEELSVLCDRVLLFVDGRVVRELGSTELTPERIARRCRDAAGW